MMKKIFCIGVIMSMLTSLCGCGTAVILKKSEEPRYILQLGENKVSLADVKTIMLEYKDVYNQYHMEMDSEIVWGETMENGITYEQQLLYHYVLDEVITLEILQMLAMENHIVLTSEEEELVVTAATAYMEQISDSAKEYCYATLEQAQALMKKYVLADKTMEFLTSTQSWEISENEARAITVQIMELSDQTQAKNAFEQLEAGTVFQQVYMDLLGESPKEYTVVRGDLVSVLEEPLYLLKTGEYTDIVEFSDEETGNMIYFIAYCVNDYLPDLTQMNHIEIQNQRKMEYVMPLIEAKRNEVSLHVDEKKLETEDLSCEGIEASFYDSYNQYLGKIAIK